MAKPREAMLPGASSRADWIRTSDLHTPSMARYQAALQPVVELSAEGCRAERHRRISGQGGIRTHGTEKPYTAFPVPLLQPLGHLSGDIALYRDTQCRQPMRRSSGSPAGGKASGRRFQASPSIRDRPSGPRPSRNPPSAEGMQEWGQGRRPNRKPAPGSSRKVFRLRDLRLGWGLDPGWEFL